jgi:hypothetical protein
MGGMPIVLAEKSKNQGIDWPSVQPDFEAKVGVAGFEPATT